MAELNKPFKHFESLEVFNNTLIASDATNTKSTWGGELQNETPEVAWESICFIEDVKKIWNRGVFYGVDEFNLPDGGEDGQVLVKNETGYEWQDNVVISTKFVEIGAKELDANGEEYVDLGLPSGNLWAKRNIGAETEENLGYYFSWGDVSPVELRTTGTFSRSFTWANYIYSKSGSSTSMSKYCTSSSYGDVDNSVNLDYEDDAARVLMGGDWQIPTNEDFQELFNICSHTVRVDNNTVAYLTFTGPNSNTLTFRLSGYGENSQAYIWTAAIGTFHYSWTRDLWDSRSDRAKAFYYDTSTKTPKITYNDRYNGCTIRGVLKH